MECIMKNALTAAETLTFNLDGAVTATEVADLRAAVGWDRRDAQMARILGATWHRAICRSGNLLVGYVDSLSDGVDDVFIRDLIVHPEVQRRGIGTVLLQMIVDEAKRCGIQSVGVLFDPSLAVFYRNAGFIVVGGGVIDLRKEHVIDG
jgi:GNAT superfamily N-acetyltransferase